MELFGNIENIVNNALMLAIPVLICITFHELAHGFTAYKLGDTTAKDMGRLTFNPIKHIDPVGLMMLLFLTFGWAKPVPVDTRNFKHPKRDMAITALAGPVSNIILAIIFFMIIGLTTTLLGIIKDPITGYTYYTTEAGLIIYRMLSFTALINVNLAVFNMLPFPPLDGSKVIFSLLPEHLYFKVMRYERFGMIILMVLFGLQMIFGINLFGTIIGYPRDFILSAISIFETFTFNLVN